METRIQDGANIGYDAKNSIMLLSRLKKIRLKTSCLIGHEPPLYCCSVKHAIKSHVIVAMVNGY